jgi:hypothetical protein
MNLKKAIISTQLAGIVEDDEKFIPQIIFGYELEPVSRIRELKPDCVLITHVAENDLKRERLQGLFGSNPICIRDICFF